MARLNEPPVSTDSLETLRKKLLRQNRDLAKSNNVRALRIRELENDCAIMLSENLELRGRILELEKEIEDNSSRRIADHALAIKTKLETQLTEFGTLLAGLGLEPPTKRHSPPARKSNKPRISFSSVRPSPSQRRLRDMAREIEELGHISETKSYPRMTMNPEQILALRSKADATDSADSPDLGPPPMSKFIDQDPVKVDSPSRPPTVSVQESPKSKMTPPETLSSPQTRKTMERPPSPEKKKMEETIKPQEAQQPDDTKQVPPKTEQPHIPDVPVPRQPKIGSKRKLSTREDMVTNPPQRVSNENEPPRTMTDKQSIREKADGKTLKELANMRKDGRERVHAIPSSRKPLSAKSTNDDMASPKKTSKPTSTDESTVAKAELEKSKPSLDRPKSRSKSQITVCVDSALEPVPAAPVVKELPCELGAPIQEDALLSPGSPDAVASAGNTRGGTPPPASVEASREASRPSRRNRTAVSYAEPNLRDKMRRPTKELLDAVAGEGRYARRSSTVERLPPESASVKREPESAGRWKDLPLLNKTVAERDLESVPASPLAGKGSPPGPQPQEPYTNSDETSPESSTLNDVDLYEFPAASPKADDRHDLVVDMKKKTAGRRAPRRTSSVVHSEGSLAAKERTASRRRSMML